MVECDPIVPEKDNCLQRVSKLGPIELPSRKVVTSNAINGRMLGEIPRSRESCPDLRFTPKTQGSDKICIAANCFQPRLRTVGHIRDPVCVRYVVHANGHKVLAVLEAFAIVETQGRERGTIPCQGIRILHAIELARFGHAETES